MNCSRPQCTRIRKKNAELWRENKKLKKALNRAQERANVAEPTNDEIAALHHLAVVEGLPVTLRHLRTWAKTGEGPQPPYDDLESWESWVAEEVAG